MTDCKHEWWATTLDGTETKRFCVKCFTEAEPVVPVPETPVYDPYDGYANYVREIMTPDPRFGGCVWKTRYRR